MNGRELIKKAFKLETVDRIPWVPFVGCHGGKLLGVPADEYLRSEEHLFNGVNEAIKRYKPDGIPVIFDLQIEAEALGCNLNWSKDTPPAVNSHPLASGIKLNSLKVPKATDARIRTAINTAKRLRNAHPDIALYGLITGPFTLALHLMGTDIFTKMYDDTHELDAIIKFSSETAKAMAEYYIEAGCDIIAIVDPMTSQIGPEHFNRFVKTPATAIFEHIRAKGAMSSFFVCGHAQQNIEVMCECRPDNISIDENIPLDYVRDACLRHNISFGGNLQLTVVLLLGTEISAAKHAAEIMDTGRNKGFILAPGCDLPYDTPPANVEAVTKVVHDEYARNVAKAVCPVDSSGQTLDMSEYGQANKVIVDIITLDSEACAPCQYMVEAVKKIAPEFEGIVEWREHKVKYRESLVFMASLMVKNIPTICIDGQITFVSRIPREEELIDAIQKRIIEKLSYKIKRKRHEVYILGKNDEECAKARKTIDKAIKELGTDIDINIVTDPDKIAEFGVFRTPAVVSARYQVKSEGHMPAIAVIKEWLKE